MDADLFKVINCLTGLSLVGLPQIFCEFCFVMSLVGL